MDESLYTGYTNDLKNRLNMHEDGKGAKYTRGRGPFEVIYMEEYSTKEAALRREYQIKQLLRSEKEKLIRSKGKKCLQNEYTKEL